MSVELDPAGPSEGKVPLGEALHRMWVAHPSATTRNVFVAVGCLLLVALQVAMLVWTGNLWALLGPVCLPPAAWLLLVGFLHQRQGWRALGLLLAVVGAFVPFYLAPG